MIERSARARKKNEVMRSNEESNEKKAQRFGWLWSQAPQKWLIKINDSFDSLLLLLYAY